LLHKVVDNESKSFNPVPLCLCKSLWDYSKKRECDDLSNNWKMGFQALDLKEKHFLNLYNSDNNTIKLSYAKDSTWLKFFGHFNLICMRATRAIMNHALIDKY